MVRILTTKRIVILIVNWTVHYFSRFANKFFFNNDGIHKANYYVNVSYLKHKKLDVQPTIEFNRSIPPGDLL